MMRCCRCKETLTEGAAYIARTPTTETPCGERVLWELPVYCTGCSDAEESYPTTLFDIEHGTWWCDHVAEDVLKAHKAIGERAARLLDAEVYKVLMGRRKVESDKAYECEGVQVIDGGHDADDDD